MTLEEAIIHAEEVAERCAVTDGNIKCESEHRQLAEWLKELKQLKEQTRWIPVSERLPDINDEVLVTYIVNGNTKKRYVETASYYAGLDEWTSYYDEYRVAGTKVEIVAWMPLPQPYRGEVGESE